MNLMNHFPYRLNLQFFAAEGEGGGTTGDQQPVNQAGGEQNPQDGGQDQQQEKMLPQSEVNNLIAKEKKKATEKILRDLGIDDFENAKEGLQKFREWQESQKTETQKQAERLQQLEQQFNDVQKEKENLLAQLAAVKAGVHADFVEDVIVLAQRLVNEDTTIDDAIAKVIEKYPHFKEAPQQQQDEHKPMFTTGQHSKENQTELDKWLNAFKK